MSSDLYEDEAFDHILHETDLFKKIEQQTGPVPSTFRNTFQQSCSNPTEARALLGLEVKGQSRLEPLSLPTNQSALSPGASSKNSSVGSSSQQSNTASLLNASHSSCTDYDDDDDLLADLDDAVFDKVVAQTEAMDRQQASTLQSRPQHLLVPSRIINGQSTLLFSSSSPGVSPGVSPGTSGGPKATPKIKATGNQSYIFGACAPQNVVAGKKWQRPITSDPTSLLKHGSHFVDRTSIDNWIFPTNLAKRDYQYHIIRYALFNNTFVSLPTGLGKTFIAAVVMLNYHRWFPKSKIIFMAPTRPLVAQQIEACYTTVGFGPKETIELTGRHRPDVRAKAYDTKKVFFMTAETVRNDLEDGTLLARDISLVIFDEAHRSSGNSAYCQVVRFLESKNIYHRILALSATPANSAEAVQAIIDNLHIGHIEMRSERSPDLAIYRNTSQVENIIVQPSKQIIEIRNMWASMMENHVKLLFNAKILHDPNPVNLRAYSVTAARQMLLSQNKSRGGDGGRPGNQNLLYAMNPLEPMARAMNYLCEQGINKFAQCIATYQEEVDEDGKKISHGKKMVTKINKYKQVIALVNRFQSAPHYQSHPKFEQLQNIILQHFASAEEGAPTRVMVFAEFRDTVQEILDILDAHRPLLRPVRFVGQKSDKTRGMSQADQENVLRSFRSGEYNVLVATIIGEEGLDIGQVDLVVTYDMKAAPIRMLQRQGRTGRKRSGRVVNLLAPGFEERSATKAEDKYEAVQKAISQRGIELYDDCPSLLPAGCKPQPLEKLITIEPTVKEVLKEVHNAADSIVPDEIDSEDEREARQLKKMKKRKAVKEREIVEPSRKARKPQPKAVRRAPVPESAPSGFVCAGDLYREMLGSTQ